MLLRVAYAWTDVSVERIVFIIMVSKLGELGTALPVTSNRKHAAKMAFLFKKSLSVELVESDTHCYVQLWSDLPNWSVLELAVSWTRNI
jgi:hypothetical protein